MILLDEEDGQLPKLDPPLPLHVRTNRPLTPTPSLPDYETSQEQLKYDLHKKKPLPKRLKWALWGLGTYFIVTVAIGVPVIVLVSNTLFQPDILSKSAPRNPGQTMTTTSQPI